MAAHRKKILTTFIHCTQNTLCGLLKTRTFPMTAPAHAQSPSDAVNTEETNVRLGRQHQNVCPRAGVVEEHLKCCEDVDEVSMNRFLVASGAGDWNTLEIRPSSRYVGRHAPCVRSQDSNAVLRLFSETGEHVSSCCRGSRGLAADTCTCSWVVSGECVSDFRSESSSTLEACVLSVSCILDLRGHTILTEENDQQWARSLTRSNPFHILPFLRFRTTTVVKDVTSFSPIIVFTVQETSRLSLSGQDTANLDSSSSPLFRDAS